MEGIRLDEVLDDQPLILQFFLDRAHKDPQLRHRNPSLLYIESERCAVALLRCHALLPRGDHNLLPPLEIAARDLKFASLPPADSTQV